MATASSIPTSSDIEKNSFDDRDNAPMLAAR
jgi:hypothetical protein